MNRSILISSVFHLILITITAMSLPFLTKKPIDLPPIVSVELIQITEKTNIPFAPKAKKIIEKAKEEEKKLVSEQAPPKKVKKIKPDSIPMPDDKVEKIEKVKEEMTEMIGTLRIFESYQKIIQSIDSMNDQSVNTIGRVG